MKTGLWKFNSVCRLLAFGLLLLSVCCQIPLALAADQIFVSGFPNTGAYQAKLLKSSQGVAVMELSGNYDRNLGNGLFNVEPRTVIAKEFYKTYADKYDFVLVFSSFEYASGDALAFYHGVRNDVKGIGVSLFDNSTYYGSQGKLQGYIDMAALSRYNLNPDSADFEKVLKVIAHEFLHRWATHVKFRNQNGELSRALLGQDDAHWSFLLDSGGSVEYGNRWRDNGDGSFTSIVSGQLYSPLDLYLMGMLRKEEVPPFYLINSQEVDPTRLPEAGVTVHGTKTALSIDDIIAAEGERQPSATDAQKNFEFGVILLSRPGQPATDAQIQAINRLREAFQTRLAVMTGGQLIANTSLKTKESEKAQTPEVITPGFKAGSANIPSALTWLKTNQTGEGFWQDNEGTRLRDTAVTLNTLAQQSGTEAAQAQARTWLAKQTPQNTDYLARRSLALDAASIQQDTQTLLANQNSDGGWGVAPGYVSNPIDTAWVISSLQRNNTATGVAGLARALTFLSNRQNSDGGWGNTINGSSTVYATTLALQALSSQTDQSARLELASAFLKKRQNADGGFGDAASTVHDTANVILALNLTGKLDAVNINAATHFLNATQRTDGSWDGSAYATALALGVVGNPGGGNWALTDFQASPTTPRDGQRVQLSVRVWNKGIKATAATVIRFYDGIPTAGGTPIGTDIAVPALEPGASITIRTIWNTSGKGGAHSLYASVDPDGQGAETVHTDDVLKTDIGIAPAASGIDLAGFDSDVLITPSRINHLPTTVGITVQANNLGNTDAGTVTLRLVSRDTGATLDQQTAVLLARSSVPVTLTLPMDKPNLDHLAIVIDPDKTVKDIDRSNNSIDVDLPVDLTVDVQVLAADIQVPDTSANPVLLGNDLNFKVKLSNNGTADSASFPVIYTLSNGTETRELAHPTIRLGAGQSQTFTLPWRIDLAGTLSLNIKLDPQATLTETSRANNEATSATFTAIEANGSNLAISYHDLLANPNPAQEGHKLSLSGLLRNTGNQAASNVEVAFYDGDPAKGGVLVAPIQTVAKIEAGASLQVLATTAPLTGTQDRLYFMVIDPAGKLTELSKDDNQAFITVPVVAMTDLMVASSDILSTPSQPKAGDTITLDVGITNSGLQNADAFAVRLYAGDPAQGQQVGADIPVAGLEAQRSTRVSFTVTLPTQGSAAQYTVVVDPLEQVLDKDRSNNSATRNFSLQGSDSFVTERYFSPNGDGIKDTTKFGFKLGTNGPYKVLVVDAAGKIVRALADGITGTDGLIEWDGKDDKGTLPQDATYSFELLDKNANVVFSQNVVLDTNRAPILWAMGTNREIYRNLTCSVANEFGLNFKYWQRYYSIQPTNLAGNVVYLSSDSSPSATPLALSLDTGRVASLADWDTVRNTVMQDTSILNWNAKFYWNSSNRPYGVSSIVLPDGRLVFLASVTRNYTRTRPDGYTYTFVNWGDEVWTVDADGANPRVVVQPEYSFRPNDGWGVKEESAKEYFSLYGLYSSADGTKIYAGVDYGRKFSGAINYIDLESTSIISSSLTGASSRTNTNVPGVMLAFSDNGYYELEQSPSGRYVSVGYSYNTVSDLSEHGGILDLENARFVSVPKDYEGNEGGSWSFDSKYLARHKANDVVGVFLSDGTEYRKINTSPIPENSHANTVVWIKNTHYLVVSGGPFVEIFDADTGELVKRYAASDAGAPQVGAGFVGADPAGRDIIAIWTKVTLGNDASVDVVGKVIDGDTGKVRPVSDKFLEYTGDGSAIFTQTGRQLLFQSDHDTKNNGVCSLSSGDASHPYTGKNIFAYESADNLTADLRATRSPSGDSFKLKGTAADANFASYKLEYSTVASPDDWHAIGSPRSVEVVDGELGQWAPPSVGRYLVRLTAQDLAGNSKSVVVRVSTYTTPMITDVYKNEDFISPNGDGIQDTLQIHYRVLDPGNFAVEIFNSNNQRIKLSERAHPDADQDHTFIWDGRDDQGKVVPDGSYRIKLLDYEFAFEVDNTPPVVKVELSPRGIQPPERHIAYSTEEVRLKEVRHEIAPLGTNTWFPADRADESYFREFKATNPDSQFDFATYRKLTPAEYFLKHRVVAVDKAGNSSSIEVQPGPRELLLSGMMRDRLQPILSNSSCVGSWLGGGALPPQSSALGEVYTGISQSDSAPPSDLRLPKSEYFEIEWEPVSQSGLVGSKFYLPHPGDKFVQNFKLGFVDLRPSTAVVAFGRLEYAEVTTRPTSDEIANLSWKSATFSKEDIAGFGAASDDTDTSMYVPFMVSAPTDAKRFYVVRLVLTDEDGTEMRSPAYSFFISPSPVTDVKCTSSFHWTVAPEQADDCSATVSDKMTLALDSAENLNALKPDHVTISRVTAAGNSDLMVSLPYPSGAFVAGKSTQFYTFSTRDWPVGEQSLSIAYFDAQGGQIAAGQASFLVNHGTPKIELNTPKDGAKLCMSHLRDNGHLINYLPLDGLIQTGSGGANWKIEVSSANNDWTQVEPLGQAFKLQVAQSASTGWTKFDAIEPDYAHGFPGCSLFGGVHCHVYAPYQWSSVISKSQTLGQLPYAISDVDSDTAYFLSGRNVPIGTNLKLEQIVDYATLGDKEASIHGDISLRVKAYGASGAQACTTPINLHVDGRVDAVIAQDKAVFSPNGDGVQDTVSLVLSSLEELKLNVNISALSQDASGASVKTPVRSLIKSQLFGAGDSSIEWDGADDAGKVLADGRYVIDVLMTDNCGNEKYASFNVDIDNTPPVIKVSSPLVGDQMGVRVPVVGEINDAHSGKYTIEYASEQDAAAKIWQPLKAGGPTTREDQSPLRGFDAFDWNNSLPPGNYVLRLTAQDVVGNAGEVLIPLVKPVPQGVINEFTADPDLFSPNGDNRLDATHLNYELLQDAKVTLEVYAEDGKTLLATLVNAELRKAGLQLIEWDGRNPLTKNVLADGNLVLKLTAETASAPIQIQSALVRVRLDATAPVITYIRPANGWATGKDPVQVTVADPLLASSELYLSMNGIKGPWQQLTQNEGAAAKVLTASLANLDEGSYGLKVIARDQAQNESQSVQALQIDKTLPKVALQSPQTGAYISGLKGATPIQGTVEEKNLARYRLLLGQGAPPVNTELMNATTLPVAQPLMGWNAKDVADGQYKLSLTADDLAGNTAQSSIDITVDNTPPVAAFKNAGQPWYIGRGSVISGTATDDNFQSFKLEISPSGAPRWSELLTSTQAVAAGGSLIRLDVVPADGLANLRLTVTDKAGNVTEVTAAVTVDSTPPAVPLNLTGKVQNKRDAQLNWNANSEADLAGYAVFRDGVRLNNELVTQPSYVDAGLSEGRYRYVVKAYDKAGNESADSNSVSLTVSSTQPVAAILAPTLGGYANGIVQITGTASAPSDFKEYRLYVGSGSAPTSWQLLRRSPASVMAGTLAEWSTLSLTEGAVYTLKLESEDLAGNVATAQAVVTVDNRAPNAPLALTASKNSADVTLNWTANTESDLQGYILMRDERIVNSTGIVVGSLLPYAIPTTNYLDKSVPDGKHAYYVQAIDKAGNLSDRSNTAEVSIDTHAPHVVINTPATGTAFEKSVYIVGSSEDTDIASVQFQYRAGNSGAWTNLGTAVTKSPWAVTWNAGTLALGNYQVQAVATDLAGQIDPAPSPITLKLTQFDPNAATRLTALANADTAQLSWTNTDAGNAVGYYVERQNAQGTWVRLTDYLLKENSYSDYGLSDGDYRYRIQTVIDTAGTLGVISNEAVAHIFTPQLEQPYTPTDQATGDFVGQTLAGLNIELRTGANNVVASGKSGADGHFEFLAVSLPLGDTTFTVRARDAAGNISRDAAVYVLHEAAPATPRDLTTELNKPSVWVLWSANTELNIVGYISNRDGIVQERLADVLSGNSSSYSDSNHVAQFAVDGDSDTGWVSGTSDGWLQVTLTKKELLSNVTIHWAGDAIPQSYVLEANDGQVWVPLLKVQDNALEKQSLKLAKPYYTDSYRIRIVSAQQAPRINEITATALVMIQNAASAKFSPLGDGVHKFTVKAVNTYGLVSPAATISQGVGDVQGPNASVLVAKVNGSDVDLTWTHPAPADVAQYQVWRDGVLLTSVTSQHYADASLPNGHYSYQIIAVDQAGNPGTPSNTASADVNVVGVVTQVVLTGSVPDAGGVVNLNWQVAGGAVPQSYTLERSLQAGGPYTAIATNTSLRSFQDGQVRNNTDYFYVVLGFDANGQQIAQSNEIVVHPRDIVPPGAPVFVYPTRAGVPLTTNAQYSELRGLAVPGDYVVVNQDGTSLTPVSTSTQGSLKSSLQIGFSAADFDVSADERQLLAGVNGRLVRYDRSSGTGIALSGISELGAIHYAAQAPVAVVSSMSGTVRTLYMVSANSNSVSAINGINPARNDSFAVSADGTQVVVLGSDASGTRGLWSIRLSDNAAQNLVDNTAGTLSDAFSLSADASQLAYADGTRLKVLNLADKSMRELDLGYAPTRMSWTPAADTLYVAVSGTDKSRIGMLTLANMSWHYLTEADQDYSEPLASADGRSYLVRKTNASGSAVVLRSQEGKEWVVSENASRLLPVRWSAGGMIHLGDATHNNVVQSIVPPGMFVMTSLALQSGSNFFGAIERDAAGNASDPAQRIELRVPATILAALSVQTSDIVVIPEAPLVGETTQIAVRAHNTGASATNVPLSVSVLDARGNEVIHKDSTFAQLDSNETRSYVFDWTPASAGQYRVKATLNAARTINEFNYDDDTADALINVSATGVPALSVHTGATHYALASTVHGGVVVNNPGPTLDGTLKLRIEDEQGYLVTDLPPVQISQLAYASQTDKSFDWPVGNTFAGNYRVVATLYDASDLYVAEGQAAFVVDADKELALTVTSDQSVYEQGDVPRLHGVVAYVKGNAPLADTALATLSLSDSSGTVVAQRTLSVAGMLAQSNAALDLAFDTSKAATGTYQLVLGVREGSADLGQAKTAFSIKTSSAVTVQGKLKLDVASVGPTDKLLVNYQIRNAGSDALSALPVFIQVIDPVALVSGAQDGILSSLNNTVDVAGGVQFNADTQLQPTAAWPLKTLLVILKVQLPDGSMQELDRVQVTVVDRVAPVVQFLTPAPNYLGNAKYDGSVSVQARDDQTAIAAVDISLDGTSWTHMALSNPQLNSYVAKSLVPHSDGRYTLYAKASDTAGNQSEVITQQLQLDLTPPTVQFLSPVANFQGNATFDGTVTVQARDAQTAVSTVEISLDGSSWTQMSVNDPQQGSYIAKAFVPHSDGRYTLYVRATDVAGNQSEVVTESLVIDATPPAVQFLSPVANFVGNASFDGSVTVQARDAQTTVSSVEISLDGTSWTQMSVNDLQQGSYLAKAFVPHTEGRYTLYARATDATGNRSEPVTQQLVIDATPPVVQFLSPVANFQGNASFDGSVTVQARDAQTTVSTVEISLDGTSWTQMSVNDLQQGSYIAKAFVPRAEGRYSLYARATDAAGNRSESVTQKMLIDLTPPAVQFVAPAANFFGNATFDGNVTVQAHDAQTAVNSVEVSLDGVSWTHMVLADPVQENYQATAFVPHQEGSYTLFTRATDTVGNQSAVITRQLIIDLTAPVIQITGVVQGNTYHTAVQPVFQATDANLDSVTATLDGVSFVSGTSVSAAGAHKLVVTATDKAGNISSKTVDFVVSPIVVSGTLVLSPLSPATQQTLVLDAAMRNDSPAPAVSAHFVLQIRRSSDNALVTSFTEDAQVESGSSYKMARTWQVTGTAGTRYLVQWSVTIAGSEQLLASQEFVVANAPVDMSFAARLLPVGKILVLARCPRASDDSTAWCTERTTQTYKPDYDPSCDTVRTQFISSELSKMGAEALVVSDETQFLKELRSGRYSTYWIDANATGLDHVTTAELRAALWRGHTLLLDGLHGAMNSGLSALGGFNFAGYSTAKPGMHTLSPIFDALDYPALATRAARLEPLSGGVSQAFLLENAATTKYAAIVSNQVGPGRVLSVGFDLPALLKSSGYATRLHTLLEQAIAYLKSTYVPAKLVTGDAFVHHLSLGKAKGQQVEVTVTMPVGSVVVDSKPAATVKSTTGTTVASWRLTVQGDQQSFDLTIKAPLRDDKFVLSSTLNTVDGSGKLTYQSDVQQIIETVTEKTLIDNSIQSLQGMTLDKASTPARLMVLQLLGSAKLTLDAKDWSNTLRILITAQGYLVRIKHADAGTVATQISSVMAAMERRM